MAVAPKVTTQRSERGKNATTESYGIGTIPNTDGGAQSLGPAAANNPAAQNGAGIPVEPAGAASSGSPTRDRLINEGDATPVTSFVGTGFGTWANGVSAMFGATERDYNAFGFDRVGTLSENPADAPKIAVTRPVGSTAGTVSRMSEAEWNRYFGSSRPKMRTGTKEAKAAGRAAAKLSLFADLPSFEQMASRTRRSG